MDQQNGEKPVELLDYETKLLLDELEKQETYIEEIPEDFRIHSKNK